MRRKPVVRIVTSNSGLLRGFDVSYSGVAHSRLIPHFHTIGIRLAGFYSIWGSVHLTIRDTIYDQATYLLYFISCVAVSF